MSIFRHRLTHSTTPMTTASSPAITYQGRPFSGCIAHGRSSYVAEIAEYLLGGIKWLVETLLEVEIYY
jgi:hypothetical protein